MFTQRKGDGCNSDLSLGLKLTCEHSAKHAFILLSSAGCSASKNNS